MLKKLVAVAALTLCSLQAHAKSDKSAPTATPAARPCFHMVMSQANLVAINLTQVLYMDVKPAADDKGFILYIHVPAARHDPQPYLVYKDQSSALSAMRSLVELAAKCR